MLEIAVGVPDEDAGCDGHRCDYEHCHGERNARHPSWFTVNKQDLTQCYFKSCLAKAASQSVSRI